MLRLQVILAINSIMKLFEIQRQLPQCVYVPNSQREKFDNLMHLLEEDAEIFDDVDEFTETYPNATQIVLIYTNPDLDYRGGGIDYELIRQAAAKKGRIMPARRLPDPEMAVWKAGRKLFIEDLLNDPNQVAQVSDILYRKLFSCFMLVSSPQEINRLIQTDH